MMHKLKYFIFALCFLPAMAYSQADLGISDTHEYYYRLISISGFSDGTHSFTMRPFTLDETPTNSHPWQSIWKSNLEGGYDLPAGAKISFIEPFLFQSYNTTVPRGGNDGAIWQGKGWNSAISMGIVANWGPLHVRLHPQVGFSENRYFDTGPFVSNNLSTLLPIDDVQRFGDNSNTWVDLGDSRIELRYAGIRAGFSNARIWSGPAVHNPLLFSANAPGFKHLHLSSYSPINTYIGSFEFAFLYGAQKPSEWFENQFSLGLQSVSYQSIAYSPSFLDGFTIGFSGVFTSRYPDTNSMRWEQAKRAFRINAVVNISDEDSDLFDANRLGTIFLRWAFPENKFEFYAEYGKNDRHVDIRDFRMQPEHHRAYLLGFIKTVPLTGNRLLSMGAEITQLNDPRSSFTRGGNQPWVSGTMGRWYYHAEQLNGFTNRGQIMGAAIGPAGQSQVITSDLFTSSGKWGVKLARISYDDGRPNETITRNYQSIRDANEDDVARNEIRNVELMIGISSTRFLANNIELSAAFEFSYIMNEHYIKENDLFNTRFELTLRRHINGWLR